jgi:hypothetical protein
VSLRHETQHLGFAIGDCCASAGGPLQSVGSFLPPVHWFARHRPLSRAASPGC